MSQTDIGVNQQLLIQWMRRLTVSGVSKVPNRFNSVFGHPEKDVAPCLCIHRPYGDGDYHV